MRRSLLGALIVLFVWACVLFYASQALSDGEAAPDGFRMAGDVLSGYVATTDGLIYIRDASPRETLQACKSPGAFVAETDRHYALICMGLGDAWGYWVPYPRTVPADLIELTPNDKATPLSP